MVNYVGNIIPHSYFFKKKKKKPTMFPSLPVLESWARDILNLLQIQVSSTFLSKLTHSNSPLTPLPWSSFAFYATLCSVLCWSIQACSSFWKPREYVLPPSLLPFLLSSMERLYIESSYLFSSTNILGIKSTVLVSLWSHIWEPTAWWEPHKQRPYLFSHQH